MDMVLQDIIYIKIFFIIFLLTRIEFVHINKQIKIEVRYYL